MNLQTLTIKDLETLQRQWFNDAQLSGKLAMIAAVGRWLGDKLNATHPPKYQYTDTEVNLIIYIDDYGNYFTVTYRNRCVCNTHFCEKMYVPGEWEAIIAELFPNAQATQNAYYEKKKEADRQKLLSKL